MEGLGGAMAVAVVGRSGCLCDTSEKVGGLRTVDVDGWS